MLPVVIKQRVLMAVAVLVVVAVCSGDGSQSGGAGGMYQCKCVVVWFMDGISRRGGDGIDVAKEARDLYGLAGHTTD